MGAVPPLPEVQNILEQLYVLSRFCRGLYRFLSLIRRMSASLSTATLRSIWFFRCSEIGTGSRIRFIVPRSGGCYETIWLLQWPQPSKRNNVTICRDSNSPYEDQRVIRVCTIASASELRWFKMRSINQFYS